MNLTAQLFPFLPKVILDICFIPVVTLWQVGEVGPGQKRVFGVIHDIEEKTAPSAPAPIDIGKILANMPRYEPPPPPVPEGDQSKLRDFRRVQKKDNRRSTILTKGSEKGPSKRRMLLGVKAEATKAAGSILGG